MISDVDEGGKVMRAREPRVRQIAPNVFCLGPRGRTQTNVYFVRSGPSWVLVDAGWARDGDRIRHAARQLFGTQPAAAIILTHDHPDHEGAALALAREWGCQVHVHPGELPVAVRDFPRMQAEPMPMDRWLVYPIMRTLGRRRREQLLARSTLRDIVATFTPESGVPFLPGWQCIPTPGHTPGHISLFRPADRVLITGDAVATLQMSLRGLMRQKAGVSGPPWYTTWNRDAARDSVQRLARLRPTVLAGGHGEPLTVGAARALGEYAGLPNAAARSESGGPTATYRAVAVTRRGGPEVLQVVERDLRQPEPDEVRIRVLAASVSAPDVQARYGHSPFRAKVPFIPGYSVIGDVDAVGPKVTSANVGDRVAALTIYGGYAEYAYARADRLIPVPAGLDPAEAVPLILNYLVAYQVLHRSARVAAGDKVLVIGASGGIGTALLQLGRLAGLRMYGLASASKHAVLEQYGAVPIDYHSQDFVEVIRRAEPQGLDVVIDGVVAPQYRRAYPLLRRGGTWVGYGNPLSFTDMLGLIGWVARTNLTPDGRTAKLYSTGKSYLNRRPFDEDWATLFQLLKAGEIAPIVPARFPLLEAAAANALLETGDVVGNIVLEAR